ncbi:MAG: hypothetical protein ACLFVZ_04450 [Actinomycetota bacterium]
MAPKESKRSEHWADKAKVIRMALTAKRMIRALAFSLIGIFGFLRLRGVPVGPTLESLPAELIFKIALFIYFSSWVLGTVNDANEQEIAYAVPPRDGKFPWQGYALGASLALVFGVMCFVDNPRHFAIALTVFLGINVVGWRYLVRKLRPEAYARSLERYRNDKDGMSMFRLEVFYRYIAGKWQWYRFLYGAALLLPLYYLAFFDSAARVGDGMGIRSKETLVSLSFLVYVVSFEAWVWVQRIKVKFATNVLEDLQEEFAIVVVSKQRSGSKISHRDTSFRRATLHEPAGPGETG